MKSNLSIKQVSGIVKQELEKFYLFLQCYGLITILLVITALIAPSFLQATSLIFSLAYFSITYYLYKGIKSRILELNNKYE